MKNKFFASREIIPIVVGIFIMGVVIFFIGVAIDGFPKPAYLLAIMIVLLLGLPSLLLVAGIICGCLMIEVTEEGIATVLFGKRLKFFKWEEITKAETKVDRTRQFVVFWNNKKKIEFYFYCLDHSRMIILKHYAPEYIIDKLNIKDNQIN